MLKIDILEVEIYDPVKNIFDTTKAYTLNLEHSLLSISKWESRWHKSFLSNTEKTNAECLDYIKCMTINVVDDKAYDYLTAENIEEIQKYIEDPMSATTINDIRKGGKKEIITSELIYYWMVALQIPWECQKWHLNRLLTLIKVCDIKNNPNGQKMSQRENMEYMKNLNQQRREALNTKG